MLAVWLVVVIVSAASGAFVTHPGSPPLSLLIGVMAPVIVFSAGLWIAHPFRQLILAVDLRLMAGIQAWRFAGLGFLALYTHGVLPGVFALPTGLGDIAIGVSAPWILMALIRQPGFVASKTFMAWNVLGIIDLVAAIGGGGLNASLATGAVGEVTTGPMAQLPLVLIPVYFVPIFAMLHVAALLQARRVRQAGFRPDQI